MKASRRLIGLLVFTSSVALAGCASDGAPETPPPADQAEQDFEQYQCPECEAPGDASVDLEEAE